MHAGPAAGDRRALYLGWLALLGGPEQYGADELDQEREPQVPPGLADLDPGLALLARILCVHPRMLRSAAPARPGRWLPALCRRPPARGDAPVFWSGWLAARNSQEQNRRPGTPPGLDPCAVA